MRKKILFLPAYQHPPLKVTYYVDNKPEKAAVTQWIYPTRLP